HVLDDFLQQLVRHLARLPFVIRSRLVEQLVKRSIVDWVTHLPLAIAGGRNKEPRRSGVLARMDLSSNGLDGLDIGTEMLEQRFDAMAQRCSRTRAAGAGAAHMQIDDALAEAGKRDVAAVLSN